MLWIVCNMAISAILNQSQCCPTIIYWNIIPCIWDLEIGIKLLEFNSGVHIHYHGHTCGLLECLCGCHTGLVWALHGLPWTCGLQRNFLVAHIIFGNYTQANFHKMMYGIYKANALPKNYYMKTWQWLTHSLWFFSLSLSSSLSLSRSLSLSHTFSLPLNFSHSLSSKNYSLSSFIQIYMHVSVVWQSARIMQYTHKCIKLSPWNIRDISISTSGSKPVKKYT